MHLKINEITFCSSIWRIFAPLSAKNIKKNNCTHWEHISLRISLSYPKNTVWVDPNCQKTKCDSLIPDYTVGTVYFLCYDSLQSWSQKICDLKSWENLSTFWNEPGRKRCGALRRSLLPFKHSQHQHWKNNMFSLPWMYNFRHIHQTKGISVWYSYTCSIKWFHEQTHVRVVNGVNTL